METILRKGNLYNPLTKKIDKLLLDSDQYDLEVTINGKSSYYRVRYNESFFEAEEIVPERFVIHRYNKEPIKPKEASSFTKTQFFKEKIKDKSAFLGRTGFETEPYYEFLQRKSGKTNINNSRTIYSFTLPSLGERKKNDVSYYEIEVELVNNRYYVVFVKEKVNKLGLQREAPLYMIYEKKEWKKMRNRIEKAVINIAIKEDYPLELLQYVFIATGRDYKLISQFFHLLNTTKSINDLLENPLTKQIVSKNPIIREELIKYLSGEQDDIDYTYKKEK